MELASLRNAKGSPSVGRNVELVQCLGECAAHPNRRLRRRGVLVVDLYDDAAFQVLEGGGVHAVVGGRAVATIGRLVGTLVGVAASGGPNARRTHGDVVGEMAEDIVEQFLAAFVRS